MRKWLICKTNRKAMKGSAISFTNCRKNGSTFTVHNGHEKNEVYMYVLLNDYAYHWLTWAGHIMLLSTVCWAYDKWLLLLPEGPPKSYKDTTYLSQKRFVSLLSRIGHESTKRIEPVFFFSDGTIFSMSFRTFLWSTFHTLFQLRKRTRTDFHNENWDLIQRPL